MGIGAVGVEILRVTEVMVVTEVLVIDSIPHGHFVRVQGPTQPLTATSSTLTKRLVESLFLHPYLKLFHSTCVYIPQCEI